MSLNALSVLQTLMNDNLPQLEQALYPIKTLRTVLQWIPFHTIPDVLLWRGRARYRPHFTDIQEPWSIERRDMAITNNTPGGALWTSGCPTEDHQICSRNWIPSVKANEKKKKMSLNNIEHIMNINTQIINIYSISNINRFRTSRELYIGKIWIKTVNWLYFLSVNKTCVCYLPGFLQERV